MIKVYPKIYLIEGYCNSYYIDDESKVLIDAGADFKGKVDILIITHMHPDHVFYAKKIKDRTKCKVLISEADNKLDLLLKHFPKWDGKEIEKFKSDEELKEGLILKTGTYSFEALSLPGHTPGSIGLYEKKHEILFSGDVIFENGFVGRTDFPGGSEESMDKTLKRIEKLKIKHLFSGH